MRPPNLLCFFLTSMIWSCQRSISVLGQSDYEVILSRLHQSAMTQASHQSLSSLLSTLQPDGAFSDLPYGSDGSDSYRTHGRRQGALAYHFLNGEATADKVVACFSYITYDAPPNTDSNWWGHLIGTPTNMWEGVVLARDIISPQLMTDFLNRYWVDTQEGAVWNPDDHTGSFSGGNFGPRALLGEVEGLLQGEAGFADRHTQVKQELHRELVLRQPWHYNGFRDDGCLHQHCPQEHSTENGYLDHTLGNIYNGSYGKEFLKYLSNMFPWFTGTSEDFDDETIEGLFSAYLECNQWLYRGHFFEPTTTGRFITGGTIVTKTATQDSVKKTGEWLLELGRHQQEVQSALHRYENITPDPEHALRGNRHFFNSDLTAHHRQEYMASVRVLSNRTTRQETWTSGSGQNIDGYFQGDGFMTVLVDGGEYGEPGKEVFMVYDWARVPGVTNLYTTDIPQYHSGSYWAERFMGSGTFVGGVSDGMVGVTTMDYSRQHVPLTALKSYFFFEDVIVVVGSRINLSESTGEDVITTLSQVVDGEYWIGETDDSPNYFHHRGLGFVFLQSDLSLHVTSDFSYINGEPMRILTAWLSHGSSPQDATVTYAMLPAADVNRTRAFYTNPEVELNQVTGDTHVVCHKPSQTVAASLSVGGSISVASCGESGSLALTVTSPCLALLTLDAETPDEAQIRVTLSDPQQVYDTIDIVVEYEGRVSQQTVQLPGDPKRGSSVTTVVTV